MWIPCKRSACPKRYGRRSVCGNSGSAYLLHCAVRLYNRSNTTHRRRGPL
ncbi:Kazal-type serine protease inhibitor domain-containing protein [Paenibacillus rhizoplanae]|uniref:Kazal-type serine protease inhibitor domain-containing protein n=1 Tax=Paenibacillus rhizoplanae TaxID=1917181 RepID=A0ABW5F0W8_9BACL